jgi:hypothetical protein
MALAPLATTADLELKGVDVSNQGLVDLMLNAASWIIRDAAGTLISEATSTVTVMAPDARWLALPGPVTAVSTVVLDGETVTDWKLLNGMLWRECGWQSWCEPVAVQVTFTHGYAEVPADIVNLCIDLAKAGIEAASEEAVPVNVVAASYTIDDYTERLQYSEQARTAMELPDVTRQWLAQRFGGGVYVTGERR